MTDKKCVNGHILDARTMYIHPTTGPKCRKCRSEAKAKIAATEARRDASKRSLDEAALRRLRTEWVEGELSIAHLKKRFGLSQERMFALVSGLTRTNTSFGGRPKRSKNES